VLTKSWAHRKRGPIHSEYFDEVEVFYRKDGRLITELCKGERYAHSAPGFIFNDEVYRGCTMDNWHGGPSGSLNELLVWVAGAQLEGYGLWMIGPE
jgi:hypothetical protein